MERKKNLKQEPNSRIVGIDFGNTNSGVAYWDASGQPKVITNLEGDYLTPSIVYFGDDEILVGAPAKNMMFIDPEHTVKGCKEYMGTEKSYFKTKSGREITPMTCAIEIFKHLRKSCVKFFSDEQAANKAVITVPAYFTENEKQAVKSAAEKAGILVLRLIHEPTAAALACGLSERSDALYLISDFGGGTYDVSLVQFSGGKSEVLTNAGEKHLGGKDVDEILLKMVAEKFRAEANIEVSPESCPEDYYAIWDSVTHAKHLLSSKGKVKIAPRAMGKQIVMEITREQYDAAISGLIKKAHEVNNRVLEQASVKAEDITAVIPVGGSSRIPAFRAHMERKFGKDKVIGGKVTPDHAIAEGAVIMAAKIISTESGIINSETLEAIPGPPIETIDVVSHSLGVAIQEKASGAAYCSVVLEKDTPAPCQMEKFYSSVNESQTGFNIQVLQGEDGKLVSECTVVAEKLLNFPARNPEEKSIKVTIGYDESGMVKVVVDDLVSKKSEDITIDFYAKAKE